MSRISKLRCKCTESFLTLTLAMCIATTPSVADERHIFVFIASPNESAHTGAISWLYMVQNNLGSLISQVAAQSGDDGAPGELTITFTHKDVTEPVSRDDLIKWWESAPSLHAVGAVALQEDKITIIDSDIYLGALKGTLKSAFLHVRQEVVPTQFQLSRDALTIVTLYALAMDMAKSLPASSSSYSICQALQTAYLYRLNLDEATRGELEQLLGAIHGSLESHACRGQS